MKVLIVTQYFWPEFFLVNSLAEELALKGHEITVLTGLPNYPQGSLSKGYSFWKGPWTETYKGVKILRVPLIPRGKGFLRLALNYLSFVIFGFVPGILRIPKNYDVIFCFGLSPVTSCIPAIFYKNLVKIPLVFWVQDLWPESVSAVKATESNLAIELIGRLTRWIYQRCDAILMQSQAFEKSILRWGGSAEKLSYVPNWFSESAGPIKEIPKWIQSFPAGFKIVFAGNIGQAQDMKTIVKAAALLREHTEIKWIIVGDGSARAELESEIKKLSLQNQVFTYGRRPVEDMPALFAAGDLMLVSLTKEPIFALTVPSKVQAYMASRRPILAALDGEGARIVEEAQAGMSCPSESPDELAAQVLKFYKTPTEQMLRMGEQGRRYFEAHFQQAKVVAEIEKICRRLVDQNKAAKNSLK